MNTEQLFLVHTHRYGFRAGEPATIVGEKLVTPPGLLARKCFEIEFKDGARDLVPVCDIANFKIISAADLHASRIPAVTR